MMLVTGTSGTCMDVSQNKGLIVVGTEEGYINVFRIDDDEFLYEKILDRQEGRIVCCSLTNNGKHLATGSTDCVRVWDMEAGHILHKMSTGRNAAKRQTVVWCIAILDDLTMFSGDSRGKLTVWNGAEGLQEESITVSKADVLTLAATDDGRTIFCAGVEPIIRKYVKTMIKRDGKEVPQWIRDVNRDIHSHDINALAIYNSKLISGGVEGCLTLSSYPPRIMYRYNPFLPRPASLSDTGLLLLRYANYIEVWRLGAPDAQLLEVNTYALLESPKKLLALKSKEGQMIISAKISPNGNWIAYTTRKEFRLFTFLTHDGSKPELSNVELDFELPALRFLEFTPDSKKLFTSSTNGTIEVINLENLSHKSSINYHDDLNSNLTNFQISTCGKYMAVIGETGKIGVWHNEKGTKWKHMLNLPYHLHTPTAIGFRPKETRLVVAYSDLKLIEYDYKAMKLVLSLNLVDHKVTKKFPVNSIVFQPDHESLTILQTETSIISVKTIPENEVDDKPSLKKKRLKTTMTDNSDKKTFAMVKSIKEIEFIGQLLWHKDSDMVAVCMSYGQLVEQLPPAMKMKKFGIS